MTQWLIDQESNKFPSPFDFTLNWGDEEESKPNPHSTLNSVGEMKTEPPALNFIFKRGDEEEAKFPPPGKF